MEAQLIDKKTLCLYDDTATLPNITLSVMKSAFLSCENILKITDSSDG